MATATATAPASTNANGNTASGTTATTIPPLWPNNQKIEVIGLTGEYASGKTLFGLTIDPPRTLVFDTEKSTSPYENLGFTRVDIADEMLAKHPNGYKPIDVFNRWRDAVKRLQPGAYRVIMLDTVSEIESGLCDWVDNNPQEFGHTRAQYQKMEGLFWGDVKDHWKMILSDLAARCETFVFTSHLRAVWSGSSPVPGKRKPKGKETLMELASLYLHLERKPDGDGKVPDKPSAIVLKSRLALTEFNAETGDTEIKPILPPRLPIATPKAIRDYILNPPNYAKLKKGELAPEQTMSADERLLIEASIAENKADEARSHLTTAELMKLAGERQAKIEADRAAGKAEHAAASAPKNDPPFTPDEKPLAGTQAPPDPNSPVTDEQLKRIRRYVELFGLTPEQTNAFLVSQKVHSFRSLTYGQADALLCRFIEKEFKQGSDSGNGQQGQPKN
jgi:hypothetical protein